MTSQTGVRYTPKLYTCLRFIHKFMDENGYPPSHADIAKHFKITLAPARTRVNRLVALGYLYIPPNTRRTMRITSNGYKRIGMEGDSNDSE